MDSGKKVAPVNAPKEVIDQDLQAFLPPEEDAGIGLGGFPLQLRLSGVDEGLIRQLNATSSRFTKVLYRRSKSAPATGVVHPVERACVRSHRAHSGMACVDHRLQIKEDSELRPKQRVVQELPLATRVKPSTSTHGERRNPRLGRTHVERMSQRSHGCSTHQRRTNG